MAHKFPLDIRQHFSTKPTTSGDGWVVKCDECNETFSILRPPPGLPIEHHGLRMLRTHIVSHQAPKGEHAYRVSGGKGDLVVAATVPDDKDRIDQVVELSPNLYMVVVFAANLRHARTKGAGLIRKYTDSPPTRHHWRLNPR